MSQTHRQGKSEFDTAVWNCQSFTVFVYAQTMLMTIDSGHPCKGSELHVVAGGPPLHHLHHGPCIIAWKSITRQEG